MRWLSVGCFVIGLVLPFAVDRLSTKMRVTFEHPPEALNISETGGSKAVESSLQLLAAYEDAQITALRAEMYLVIRVIIVAGIGTALFIYAISD